MRLQGFLVLLPALLEIFIGVSLIAGHNRPAWIFEHEGLIHGLVGVTLAGWWTLDRRSRTRVSEQDDS